MKSQSSVIFYAMKYFIYISYIINVKLCILYYKPLLFFINVISFCENQIIPRGTFSSVQFSSGVQSCPTLCDPMNRSTPGLPVHHQLPECTQTHVHRVSDAIQPSHPLPSPSPVPNPSQHQSLFQWVNSSHEVAKLLGPSPLALYT